jgi:hypothetical protein
MLAAPRLAFRTVAQRQHSIPCAVSIGYRRISALSSANQRAKAPAKSGCATNSGVETMIRDECRRANRASPLIFPRGSALCVFVGGMAAAPANGSIRLANSWAANLLLGLAEDQVKIFLDHCYRMEYPLGFRRIPGSELYWRCSANHRLCGPHYRALKVQRSSAGLGDWLGQFQHRANPLKTGRK